MKKKPGFAIVLLFVLALIGIFKYIEVLDVLDLRPQATHLWAQTDRASVARNYAQESMNFFLPRVHEVKDHEGITGMEFPLMNYLAAIAYKIFGFHEYLYRGLMLLLVSIGLFTGMQLFRHYLKKLFIAFILILCWYFSPVFVFYSANFLPDIAALMFSVIAWYFFLTSHGNSEKNTKLTLAFVFFALSSLVKITAIINPLALLCVLLCERYFLKQHKKSAVFKKSLIGIAVVICVTASWYIYANILSTIEKATYFTLEIHPPKNLLEFKSMMVNIIDLWGLEYYPRAFYILLFISSLYILLHIKSTNKRLLLITLFLYLGSLCFALLMLNQFQYHDYYIIPLYISVFFHLLLFMDTLKNGRSIPARVSMGYALLFLCIFMLKDVKRVHHYRYHSWHNDTAWQRYYDMEGFLRQLHIKKNDITVSMYDESPNISLYFMNQKGWSINKNHDAGKIDEAFSHAHYAVLNDSSILKNTVVQKHLDRLLGLHQGLMVYSLK